MTQWLKEIKKKFGVHVIKFKIATLLTTYFEARMSQ